jgi:hypothetical protein
MARGVLTAQIQAANERQRTTMKNSGVVVIDVSLLFIGVRCCSLTLV